jgi:hypothetical protein
MPVNMKTSMKITTHDNSPSQAREKCEMPLSVSPCLCGERTYSS